MKKIVTAIITLVIVAALFPLTTSAQKPSPQMFFKAAGSPVNPKVQVSWNRYHSYDGIKDFCQRLEKAHPNLVTFSSAGKSYEGRDMMVLTITEKGDVDHKHKPGYFMDANVHSAEIQGSEMAMYMAWYLTEMYAEGNVFIRELLRDKTIYIMPTISPDGRENFMWEPNTGSSPRGGMDPRDNDRDGLFDEDLAVDLNNDGIITQMRRRNPKGDYKSDPTDPRRMIRVQPGEQGEWELLGTEGQIDHDGDGRAGEDRKGNYDPNRDWGYNWRPNYIQGGASQYPFALPESRAVRDFGFNHKNIAGTQLYHNTGGMILRGPSVQGSGSEVYTREDNMVLDRIGSVGEKMIPGYRLLTIWSDLYTVWGGEYDWWYGAMGAYPYSNELWTGYLMFNEPGRGDQYEFDRLLLFGDAFVPWEEVDHPVFGKVEVGGINKNFGRIHPGFLFESDAHRNTAFCIFHAYHTPQVKVGDVEIEDIGGGLKSVTATITNDRLMPTHSGQNQRYNIDPPNYVYLDGGNVIAGFIVNERDRLGNDFEQEKNPQRMEIRNISGESSVKVRWIVSGGNRFTVRVESVKGGRDSKEVR